MKTVTLELPDWLEDVSIEDHGNGPSLLIYLPGGRFLHLDGPGVHVDGAVVVGFYQDDHGNAIDHFELEVKP